MPKEDSLPAPTSATLQFRRPKRGNKTHALDAGPTHDGRHYSAAVCGYRPTGLNPACFGWTDARNCSPCLMCEAVLVARGDLDAASDLTGRLYDDEPPAPVTGELATEQACAEVQKLLTSWYRGSSGDDEATVTIDVSSVVKKRLGWTADATLDRDASDLEGGRREQVARTIDAGGAIEDFAEYGALPSMMFAKPGSFRVVVSRPSGAPRKRDPRLTR